MAIPINKHECNLLPPADLMKEIERLQESLREERDRHLRTLADLKNYRRHVERDGNRMAEDGKRDIILALLEIVDDLEKALQWTDEGEQTLTKGVRNIHQKLLSLLENLRVLPFESVGVPFNHDLHEAVCVAESKDMEQGTVVNELRRGYLWKDELLRPAQVRVAG
jgi:molecular chaperone GrpE